MRTFVWLLVIAAAGGGGFVTYTKVHRSSRSNESAGVTAMRSQSITSTAATPPVDPHVLPIRDDVRPAVRSATFQTSIVEIGHDGSGPYEYEGAVNTEVDYFDQVASMSFHIRGDVDAEEIILTPDFTYSAPSVFASFVRSPTPADAPPFAERLQLRIYSDVVTPDVREAATNISVSVDTSEGVAVTVYEFDAPIVLLADADGALSPGASAAVGLLKPELSLAHVILDVDDEGVVQMLDVELDKAAWKDAIETIGKDTFTIVSNKIELLGTSDHQRVIEVPTEFVIDTADEESGPSPIQDICQIERNTMRTALESWFAQNGGTVPPTEQQLVDEQFLRQLSTTWDIDGGEIVPQDGGGCD